MSRRWRLEQRLGQNLQSIARQLPVAIQKACRRHNPGLPWTAGLVTQKTVEVVKTRARLAAVARRIDLDVKTPAA